MDAGEGREQDAEALRESLLKHDSFVNKLVTQGIPGKGMLKSTQSQWLALIRAPGVGSASLHKLLHHFGSIAEVFSASAGQLHTAGLKADACEAILHPDESLIASDSAWLDEPNHHLLTWGDPDYPVLLREIPGPPAALFLNGNPE